MRKISLILILSLLLSISGCDIISKEKSQKDGFRQKDRTHEDININNDVQTETGEIIEDYMALNAAIAEQSGNYAMSYNMKLRDVNVWKELDSYYTENPEQLVIYGIRGLSISYADKGEYINAEITPDYEMYMRIIIAHETENADFLTAEELEVYEEAERFARAPFYGLNDLSKVDIAYSLHCELVDKIEYDDDYEQNENAFNVYGALIEGLAVCQGYTQAYKLLLHLAGLESIIVTGEANGDLHAWNLVNYGTQDEPQWYHADTTWDDQTDGLSGKYFNVNDEILAQTHTWKRENYPAANSLEHNYFNYSGRVATNVEELKDKVDSWHKVMGITNHQILCKFDVTVDDLKFVNEFDNVNGFKYSIDEYGEDLALTLILERET